MHAAPSVTYPVGRSRFEAGLLAVLWLLTVAAAVAWTWQVPYPGWRQALVWAAVAACGIFAVLGWRRSPVGSLAWDGGGWQWRERDIVHAGRAALALDLQSRLLLRWVPAQGRGHWLWAERASAPPHWDALRRAVYSRPNNEAPPGATPPVAER